jgi:hypothetical protein
MKVDRPKLIWIPEEVNVNKVEEEQYKNFLLGLEAGEFSGEISYIRGKKSRLLNEITDLAESLKLQKKKIVPPKLSVLLDTHYVDQISVLDLYRRLIEEKVQPFLNPQESDPVKTIQSLEERITQVENLIFYFGEVSEQWIKERFIAARQYIANSKLRPKRFLLFLMPPEKDPAEVAQEFSMSKADIFDNSNSAELQVSILRGLLQRIKG